jgi:hypothetical protein
VNTGQKDIGRKYFKQFGAYKLLGIRTYPNIHHEGMPADAQAVGLV